MSPFITTEELHLVYRALVILSGDEEPGSVAALVMEAASELARFRYRQRTGHDPLPGQTSLING